MGCCHDAAELAIWESPGLGYANQTPPSLSGVWHQLIGVFQSYSNINGDSFDFWLGLPKQLQQFQESAS
jgi:hypothetical protein